MFKNLSIYNKSAFKSVYCNNQKNMNIMPDIFAGPFVRVTEKVAWLKLEL